MKNKNSSDKLSSHFVLSNKRAQMRYQKLMEAATEVFLEKGFEEANMYEIVKRSGGSLSTVYKFFGNKEQLFVETLLHNTETLFEDIIQQNLSYEGKFETFLYDVGNKFLSIMHDERVFSFHRLIVQEGFKNDAKIGTIFFKCAVERTSQIVGDYFAQEKEKGNIDVEDPLLAAHQFVQVVKEPLFFAKVLGIDTDNALFDAQKALRQTVKIFAKGMLNTPCAPQV